MPSPVSFMLLLLLLLPTMRGVCERGGGDSDWRRGGDSGGESLELQNPLRDDHMRMAEVRNLNEKTAGAASGGRLQTDEKDETISKIFGRENTTRSLKCSFGAWRVGQ
jgi:hypothetical protein